MLGITLILVFFWLPAIFVIWKNILWDLYIWQVKEYRTDRMLSHLLNQEEDKKQSNLVYALKVSLLIGLIVYLFVPKLTILLLLLPIIFGLFSFESILTFEQTISRRLIRPKISIRNIIILILSLLTILIPFVVILVPSLSIYKSVIDDAYDSPIYNDLEGTINSFRELLPDSIEDIQVYPVATLAVLFSGLFAVAVDLTTPLIVTIWVLLTEPMAQFKRMRIISKAKTKISKMENLKVIGITGSFGKTTTKEILYQILKSKYKVSKTPQNFNSAVGVAIAVLEALKPDSEIFIAEMGAYRKREIEKATDIAKPDIAIVTGIDSQHISLFGSQENIMKTKFEIIENARDDAKVILNGDNEFALRMASMTDKETLIYFTGGDDKKIVTTNSMVKRGKNEFPKTTTIFAHSIQRSKKGVAFQLRFLDEDFKVDTNIQAAHFVSNVLAAVTASFVLGVEMRDIVKVLNETKFDLPYLNRRNGLNNTTLLDDGYNVNSTGFLGALDELEHMKPEKSSAKKIVMTKGITELGWEKKKVYKNIAKRITEVSQGLITSDKDLIQKVREYDKEFNIIEPTDDIRSFIKAFNIMTEDEDIILIEGPMHGKVLNEIIDKS